MYRRFLTFLLLPAMLLTQWANGSRCMGGCGATGQDSRPHVHMNAVLIGTPVAKKCGCHRQRETNVATDSWLAQASLVSDSTATIDKEPCRGSDNDIVYFSFDHAFGGRTSPGCIGIVASDDQAQQQFAGLCAFLTRNNRLPSHFFSRIVALPIPDSDCPLYLRVCALLI